MRKALAVVAVVLGLLGSPRQAEADYIYTGGCSWEASGIGYAAGYCPHRWEYGGPQYFRIRMTCQKYATGGPQIVKTGPLRYGGNWIASSTSCPSTHPYRRSGGTWLLYL